MRTILIFRNEFPLFVLKNCNRFFDQKKNDTAINYPH